MGVECCHRLLLGCAPGQSVSVNCSCGLASLFRVPVARPQKCITLPLHDSFNASTIVSRSTPVHRHDSRLVRKAMVMDWLKKFLSTKHGYKAVTVTLMSMPAWGTSILIILHHPDTAKRVGATSMVCLTWLVMGVSLCCCWSLLTIIIQRRQVNNLSRVLNLHIHCAP